MAIQALQMTFYGAAGDAEDRADVRGALALLHPCEDLQLPLGDQGVRRGAEGSKLGRSFSHRCAIDGRAWCRIWIDVGHGRFTRSVRPAPRPRLLTGALPLPTTGCACRSVDLGDAS